jgi:hypothetical protein
MNTQNWSFEEFSDWLTTISEALREGGFIVEIQLNDAPRSSIRLRAERGTRVGELTVWDDGMASEAVIDLQAGDFVHMHDGTQLTCEWENQLEVFFEQTRK